MRNPEDKPLERRSKTPDELVAERGIAVLDHLRDIDMAKAHELDGYVVSLCLRGKGSVELNGRQLTVGEGDLLVFPPSVLLESTMMSVDFECRCLLLDREYITKVLPMLGNYWDAKFLFEQAPVIALRPEERDTFCQYHALLGQKTAEPYAHPYAQKVVDALLQAFIYDFQGILARLDAKNEHLYTSAESHFKRFVDLLSTSYPKNRRVAWYADQLHVTPKYLTSVCVKIGQEPASKIIDRYVMKDVERLLRYTRMSVKEIANELEFPNISFFGKYVRQRWGVSPRKLREGFK